jgi:hypothetical protein
LHLKSVAASVFLLVILWSTHLQYSQGIELPSKALTGLANGTVIDVNRPSNITILLKDKDLSSSNKELFTSILPAITAIFGTAGGSYFTYIWGKRMEENRVKTEKERENELRLSLRDAVRHELLTFHDFINESLLKIQPDVSGDINIGPLPLGNILSKLKTFPTEYLTLPLDRKAVVFEGKTLTKIQQAYEVCTHLSNELESKNGNGKIRKQRIDDILQTVKDALDSIPIRGNE